MCCEGLLDCLWWGRHHLGPEAFLDVGMWSQLLSADSG